MAANDRRLPADFHALYDVGARLARGSGADDWVDVRGVEFAAPAPGPDLVIDYDDVTRQPKQLARRSGVQLSSRSAASPAEAVDTFLREHADLWRMTEEEAANVAVLPVSTKGLRTVRLVQRVDGVEVFNSDVVVALSPQNEVLSLAGQLFGGTSAARASRRAPEVSPEQAIAKAASDLTGSSYHADAFAREEDRGDSGDYRIYRYAETLGSESAFERPVRLKKVVFPLGPSRFAPGYYMELWIKGYPGFSYVIDSEGEPDVLFRRNLAAHASFNYRVYNTGDAVLRPEDGPAPGTPHPTGRPDGFQAPEIASQLVNLESLLPGKPWLPDGATTTRGNNCIAYADISPPNGWGGGDVIGQISSPGSFDYTYDHSRDATDLNNLQAGLVGMFFMVNWLHDRWYEAGFDEAAGNAQQDNFGLGGHGGDPILAEGNDFSGTDNANMQTPADGSSPRMQMYRFVGMGGGRPSRTSNLEALIVFHEMGHYITNRLIGNGNGLTNPQGRAMGEGWGDFFAVCMTSQAGDDFATGAFATGGWTDITPSFQDNYYYSIRRYPYSVDMKKNPLTFKHIGDAVMLPSGVPRNPKAGLQNSEEHNAGEVWCAVLWEVFVNLVQKHGHADAERRVLDYVIGGLKITPSRPTFTQARDAILTAIGALDPGDLQSAWAGFAKRGMGSGAVSPPSSSHSMAGVVESFTRP